MIRDDKLVADLRENGYVGGADVELIPLTGGVSSEVTLVRSAETQFVVKRALSRLKVQDEWYCDPRRSDTERRGIAFASRFMPAAVPRILGYDASEHWIVMEYLGEEFFNWKSQLMSGCVVRDTAERAGQVLAALHDATWGCSDASSQFETTDDFRALRIDPYLLTAAKRHRDLRKELEEEAHRLACTRLALVHGDFSSKNIMVSPDRLVILDWEVAWYGDPAFDSAFLLNLLYLKSLRFPHQLGPLLELIQAFRRTYADTMTHFDEDLAARICRLTLMLMLARMDGKSPAEYLVGEEWSSQRELVQGFVKDMLREHVSEFTVLDAEWTNRVNPR